MIKRVVNIYYKWKLLVFAGTLIVTAVLALRVIWTPEEELVQLKGTVRYADTHTETFYDNSGRKKTKLILTFLLQQHDKRFTLDKTLEGTRYFDKELSVIKRRLRHYDTISVGILEDEVNEYAPTVYSISTPEKDIYAFEQAKSKERGTFITIGIIFLIFGLIVWIARITNTPTKTDSTTPPHSS